MDRGLHNTSRLSLVARRPASRGVMLLEVVLALTILVASLAAIGIQINTALRVGYENERRTQAVMLAEAKLALLDTGALVIENEFDCFGLSFPGYFWQFDFEPYDDVTPGMFMVRLDILYDADAIGMEVGDATESDIEDAELVMSLHTLRPLPPVVDLQRDFGFSDDQLEEVSEKLGSACPELDIENINPADIAQMDPLSLLDCMPALLESFGAGFGFNQDQINAVMQGGLEGGLPIGGSDSLQDIIQGAGGQGGGRGSAPAGRGNDGGGRGNGPGRKGGS